MYDRIADALEASLDRHGWLWGLALTLAYAIFLCGAARAKAFWFDELFTLYIARLPAFAELWKALLDNVDLNPPGVYVLTRLFGEGTIASRVPEMIGYWLMSVCLFRFVQKRCGSLYGFLAALLPTATKAIRYAEEARPYGLVLGCCGLALVCWQASKEHRVALVGLALSLAAAVSLHYYAVLIFPAIAVGEVMRRRVDVGVWLAMLAGALPLLAYRQFVLNARQYFTNFVARPEDSPAFEIYKELLTTDVLIVVIAVAAGVWLLTRHAAKPKSEKPAVPIDEIAAMSMLAILPFLCWAISKLVVGQIVLRYALSTVVGLAALAAYALYEANAKRQTTAIVALLIALLAVHARSGSKLLLHPPDLRPEYLTTLERIPSNLPIAFANCFEYVETAYYQSAALAARTACIGDLQEASRQKSRDAVERAVLALSKYAPVNVQQFRPYLDSHREFLLYSRPKMPSTWVLDALVQAGVELTLVSRDSEGIVWRARVP